jgi:hypothetical protein
MLAEPFRLFRRLLLLALILLVSGGAWAAAPRADVPLQNPSAASPEREVRTGTTLVEAPEVPSARGSVEVSDSAEAASHAPPADAPHFAAEVPKLPSVPASHSTQSKGWIRFAYHPSVRARVLELIDQSEAIRAELRTRLGQPVLRKVVVHVARTPGEMASLAPEGAPFPKYAAGVAYPQLGLVLLTIAPVHPNSQHDLMEVFKHELSHVALHDAVLGKPVPRWFNEGFAVFASGESSLVRWQTLATATLADTLLPLERLERSFPADDVTASVAYAEAVDVVRFLVRREEQQRFAGLVGRLRDGQTFERALKDSYGTDLASLEFEWREDVARRFTFWPVFFSGSMIWVGALGLFIWAWRRRRKRSQETLQRWAREEAAEAAEKPQTEQPSPRLHIVIARSAGRGVTERRPRISEVEIPKVEHDGQWHTLH